jgi:hypothetical protein
MEIWVTKYALTSGIIKAEVEDFRNGCVIVKGGDHHMRFCSEWYTTEREAMERAETLKKKKIKSLEKQLEKLKNIKIQIKEVDNE